MTVCADSSSKVFFLIQHDNAPVHKARSTKKCFLVEDFSSVHGFLTTILSTTFRINWKNKVWKSQALSPTVSAPASLMLLWINGRKSLQPGSKILWKALSRRVETVAQFHTNVRSFEWELQHSDVCASSFTCPHPHPHPTVFFTLYLLNIRWQKKNLDIMNKTEPKASLLPFNAEVGEMVRNQQNQVKFDRIQPKKTLTSSPQASLQLYFPSSS